MENPEEFAKISKFTKKQKNIAERIIEAEPALNDFKHLIPLN